MFQTRSALKARIRELERQLSEEEKQAFYDTHIENRKLPPVKSPACKDCKHMVQYFDKSGCYVLGCAKAVRESCFELSDQPTTKPYWQQQLWL